MQYKRRHLQGNSRQVPLSAIKDEAGCWSKVKRWGRECGYWRRSNCICCCDTAKTDGLRKRQV